MKKFLSILLISALVLGLCACGSSGGSGGSGAAETAEAAGLKVGYDKINITPSYTVNLTGYGDDDIRTSDQGNLIAPLYATCIAVNSGEDTILIYTIDNLSAPLNFQMDFRANISIATGIPDTNIFFGATHTHHGPSMSGQYPKDLTQWLVTAGQNALEDLAPATMSACKPTFEGMTFVRHYKNDDGTYAGSNFGYYGNLIGHATEADSTGVLVKFDREDGKKDVLMVNWQAHTDCGSALGRYDIAPSWVGPLRDKLESLSDMHVAYFTGASGNLNPDSKIASEAHNLHWYDGYGEKLAELFAGAMNDLQPVGGTAIKTARQTLEVSTNHQWDHMINEANEVYQTWMTTRDATAANNLARKYDISSRHHASAIRRNVGKGLTENLEVNAFCIGDLGFTTGTYEMFCGSGMFVKENSPFDTTFIISGNCYYIPTRDAYETYRCYESDTSLYAVGTAEIAQDAYVEMLKGLK